MSLCHSVPSKLSDIKQCLVLGSEGLMNLLRFKVGDVAGSSYMSRSIYQPLAVHGLFAGQPGGGPPHVHLAIEESYALSRSALLAPTSLPATEPRLVKKYMFAPNVVLVMQIFRHSNQVKR